MKRVLCCCGLLAVISFVVGCNGSGSLVLPDTAQSNGVVAGEAGDQDTAPAAEKPQEQPGTDTPAQADDGAAAQTPADTTSSDTYAGGFSREQRTADAKMIIGMFERGYAPRPWKEEFFAISFVKNSDELLAQAEQDIGDLDFYDAIARYVSGFHDSHTSYEFPSTRMAMLPFDVDWIEGKIIVAGVDESVPFAVGDELISLCGEDAADARASILPYIGEGNPDTELRIATSLLTMRKQSFLSDIPSGACTVVVKSRADGTTKEAELEWKVEGYEMAELNNPSKAMKVAAAPKNILQQARMRVHPLYRKIDRLNWGSTEPFFPLWSSYVQRTAEPFPIGTFEIDGKKIGFMRIPEYSADAETATPQLAKEIAYLEDNTEAIVIDQTSNPGGDVCWGLNIASMFFATPQKEIKDRWRANRDNLMAYEAVAMQTEEGGSDQKLSTAITENMREAMKNGDVLTDAFPICYADGLFNPYTDESGKTVTYTKPVLMLIDDLDASAADYFPALMQDLGRVTLFGKQTIGAGGAINVIQERIGYAEAIFSYTVSLGWREPEIELPDGRKTHYIENVGVTPEIEYDLTIDDVVNEYENYRKAVELSVLSLLP